jgi:hypothetical protein
MGVGNIQFQDEAARIVRDDPRMRNITPSGIRRLLHDFVRGGGQLDERAEQREEYREERSFWYRAIIPVEPVAEFPRGLFVEVILADDDEAEPFVEIVSAHPQLS